MMEFAEKSLKHFIDEKWYHQVIDNSPPKRAYTYPSSTIVLGSHGKELFYQKMPLKRENRKFLFYLKFRFRLFTKNIMYIVLRLKYLKSLVNTKIFF